MTKKSRRQDPPAELVEELARWGVIANRLRPIIATSVKEDGNVVAALLALTTCAADLISASANSSDDLEERLQHYLDMVSMMSRGKFVLLGKGPTPSLQ